MLIDRLRAYMTGDELSRIVAEAKSPQRRINASIISPLCAALERAAIDGNIPKSQEKLPRRIVQFWDQKEIPAEVENCMASWRAIPDFAHVTFDEAQAREFIQTEYEPRHLEAYDLCNHPAMKSDLFRLAYLYHHGGVYVDADDTYEGSDISRLLEDGVFRLRTASFKSAPSEPPATIYNNNPIFCAARDDILRKALERATTIMLSLGKREFYNMLVITGPLNLSLAVYVTALDCIANGADFRFCPIIGWDDVARKNRDMEYQRTTRNWRMAQLAARNVGNEQP
ncbi:MAG TPA: glycosyltransferase [Rhizomicrobium sp.]|jgi:mannosyltransferase OCH1-like enzyme|nr:glycosyltransferase [Rhizomicrobium sp.]